MQRLLKVGIVSTAVLSAGATESATESDSISVSDNRHRWNVLTALRGSMSENILQAKTSSNLKLLLGQASDALSAAFYKGNTVPLNQNGYDESLGNVPMTAFILRAIDRAGLTVTDSDALQGFTMYYDGTCMKKAYKDLVEEMARGYQEECHGTWLAPKSLLLKHDRKVVPKEKKAIQLREAIMTRSAAYAAAKQADEGDDSVASTRNFIREYIKELGGTILDSVKFDAFAENFISTMSSTAPLHSLTDSLIEASESKGAFLRMPHFDSRSVHFIEEPKVAAKDPTTSIGNSAPLTEAGYREVARTKSAEDMSFFILRVAKEHDLEITDKKKLYAFAPWYNNQCAFQSYNAIVSELHSQITRGAACGGGWVASVSKLASISDVYATA